MKKLISLILVLCMACMLIPAMAEESIAGEWYYSYAGITMVLVLGEDGSASFTMPGAESASAGTWTLDGEKITITIEDSPAEGTYADGKITLGEGDAVMAFTREKPEEIKIAEVNPAAAVEDFDGEWTPKYVGANGMTVDVSMAGQEMPGVILKDGALKFTGSSSISSVFGTNSLPLTFADGALSFSLSLGEMALTIKAEMLQDGMIAVTLDVGMTLVLYMEKTGEAPETQEEPAA